ncbi:MAG: hypothetical protein R3F61_20385 [Myxococcota bacterium]
MRPLPRLAALVVLAGCTAETPTEPSPRACNGLPALCDRALDEVVFVKTHNAHASEERGYHQAAMNHVPAIPTQLADGVRSLNVDVYAWDTATEPTDDPDPPLWVCHGFCVLGHQLFSEVLVEIDTFLAANPDEVLALDFQLETDRASIQAEIEASGLSALAVHHVGGEPWPTLAELIDSGQRVVITGGAPDSPDWWLRDDETLFSTHWGTREASDFSCDTDRAPFEHALFQLDHTLTSPIASPELAATGNVRSVLEPRIAECTAATGHTPSWVSVDYYTVGDVLEVVAELNAREPAQ